MEVVNLFPDSANDRQKLHWQTKRELNVLSTMIPEDLRKLFFPDREAFSLLYQEDHSWLEISRLLCMTLALLDHLDTRSPRSLDKLSHIAQTGGFGANPHNLLHRTQAVLKHEAAINAGNRSLHFLVQEQHRFITSRLSKKAFPDFADDLLFQRQSLWRPFLANVSLFVLFHYGMGGRNWVHLDVWLDEPEYNGSLVFHRDYKELETTNLGIFTLDTLRLLFPDYSPEKQAEEDGLLLPSRRPLPYGVFFDSCMPYIQRHWSDFLSRCDLEPDTPQEALSLILKVIQGELSSKSPLLSFERLAALRVELLVFPRHLRQPYVHRASLVKSLDSFIYWLTVLFTNALQQKEQGELEAAQEGESAEETESAGEG